MINQWPKFALSCLALVSLMAMPLALAFAQQPAAEQAITRRHDDPQLKWSPCPPIFPKGCEVTILRGDPVNGGSDVFLRIPANYKLPSHWHTSPEHMILVAGQLQVTYEGQKPSLLKAGSYAYGPAKARHEGRCGKAGACVLFISFESPIDAVLTEERATK